MLDVVRYLTTAGKLPAARMQGYDYVLAGNGVFKRAMNRHVEVMLPLAGACVAGLPEAVAYVKLRGRRFPEWILNAALADARRRAMGMAKEAMYHLVRADGKARLMRPAQRAKGGGVAYEGGSDPAIVCDLHSHHHMAAFFSDTDNRDEVGFRFYAVLGRIFEDPQIAVRVGVYGDHWPVLAGTLFEGIGACREVTLWKSKSGIAWR